MEPLQLNLSGDTLRLVALTSEYTGMAVLNAVKVTSNVELVGFLPVSHIKRGKGRESMQTEIDILDHIAENQIPLITADSVNSDAFKQALDDLKPDLVLVGIWPEIVKDDVLEHHPNLTFINIHGALLPKNRGCCPFSAPIYYGEKKTGFTIHLIDSGIDTGHILYQAELDVLPTDTVRELDRRVCSLLGQHLPTFFTQLIKGELVPRPQEGDGNYLPPYNYQWGWIQWDESPQVLDRRMRSISEYLYHITTLRDVTIGFEEARVIEVQQATPSALMFKPKLSQVKTHKPGSIVSITPNGIEVATKDIKYRVLLNRPAIPNALPTQVDQFLKSIKPGDQFVSPYFDGILENTPAAGRFPS